MLQPSRLVDLTRARRSNPLRQNSAQGVKVCWAKGLSFFAAGFLVALPALADIKIGFVTTLTTPAAVIGRDMQDAVDLAVEHIGGTIGSESVEIIYADDEFNSQKRKAGDRTPRVA